VDDELFSLREALESADRRLAAGKTAAPRVWATGFTPLDGYLGGGLRAGEMTLLGGTQGIGKTTLALQMLRNIVAAGGCGMYFSFEHDAETMLQRLLILESAEVTRGDAMTLRALRSALENRDGSARRLRDRLAGHPGGAETFDSVENYGERLLLRRSSAAATSVGEIRRSVEKVADLTPLVVVDYLQKVAVPDGPEYEDERVTVVAEGLKDLALEAAIPVLAIVAGDKEGVQAGRRMRMQHFRGSTALAYEADVVLVLNDKFDVVARHHLEFDPAGAERFHEYAVLSLEKNRNGLDRIDVEFRRRFELGRYDTAGQLVSEKLIDERVFRE
jgi:replicative DNA helicase